MLVARFLWPDGAAAARGGYALAGLATVAVKHPNTLLNDAQMGDGYSPTSQGVEWLAGGRSVPVGQADQFHDFTDMNRVIDGDDNSVTVGPVVWMQLGES